MSPGWLAISAIAFATSSAAPPPMPMMLSAPCALYAAAPATTWPRTGLPATPENVALFKTHMVQFVGQATGGPQVYEGQDMATAHAGMQITNEEFDRLAGHLEAALDAYSVPDAEKQELFAIVETTRSAIVAPADTAAM